MTAILRPFTTGWRRCWSEWGGERGRERESGEESEGCTAKTKSQPPRVLKTHSAAPGRCTRCRSRRTVHSPANEGIVLADECIRRVTLRCAVKSLGWPGWGWAWRAAVGEGLREHRGGAGLRGGGTSARVGRKKKKGRRQRADRVGRVSDTSPMTDKQTRPTLTTQAQLPRERRGRAMAG